MRACSGHALIVVHSTDSTYEPSTLSTVVNGLARSPYVLHVRPRRFLHFASVSQLNWLPWRRLGPLNVPVCHRARCWPVLSRQQPDDDPPEFHRVSRREYREDSKERRIIDGQTPFERAPQASRGEGNGHQVHHRGRVPPGRSVGAMGQYRLVVTSIALRALFALLLSTHLVITQINSGPSPYEAEDDFFVRSQDDSSIQNRVHNHEASGRPRGQSESCVGTRPPSSTGFVRA
jgi:hypothetical protein